MIMTSTTSTVSSFLILISRPLLTILLLLFQGNILDRLKYAQLEFKCFYSVQRDEIYCKIRANAGRIKTEMNRIGYKVQFDRDKLRTRLQTGGKDENTGEVLWKPIIIIDEMQQTPLQPYDFIYGAYNNSKNQQTLFKQYPTMSGIIIINIIIIVIHYIIIYYHHAYDYLER